MPTTVERLPELPIILARYSGHITVGDVLSVFTRSADLIRPDDEVLYRIVCIEDIDVDFSQVLHFAQAGASDTPGSTSDPRLRIIMVGHDKWTKLFVQFMSKKQFGEISLPCFISLDQALEYVQMEMAKP
jgi:hypothetical protein